MSQPERYAIDEQTVVSETVDDEAIVVNLANGYYYSFDPTATVVWSAVQARRSVAEMVAELRGRYDCAALDPEAPLRRFLSALIDERLIVPGGEAAAPAGPGPRAAAPASGSDPRAPFQPPAFQRFTDMHAFLLVDPIHEVDETGWPNLPPGSSAGRA